MRRTLIALLLVAGCGGASKPAPAPAPAPARAPSDAPTRTECEAALAHAFRLAPIDGMAEADYIDTFADQCVGQATVAWVACVEQATSGEQLDRCGCVREPTHCR